MRKLGFVMRPFLANMSSLGQGMLLSKIKTGRNVKDGSAHRPWVWRLSISLFFWRALSLSLAHTHLQHIGPGCGATGYFSFFRARSFSQKHTLSFSLHHGPWFRISLYRSLFRAVLFSLTQTQTSCVRHTQTVCHTHTHTHTQRIGPGSGASLCLSLSLAKPGRIIGG